MARNRQIKSTTRFPRRASFTTSSRGFDWVMCTTALHVLLRHHRVLELHEVSQWHEQVKGFSTQSIYNIEVDVIIKNEIIKSMRAYEMSIQYRYWYMLCCSECRKYSPRLSITNRSNLAIVKPWTRIYVLIQSKQKINTTSFKFTGILLERCFSKDDSTKLV